MGNPRAMGGQVFKSAAWFKPIPVEMKIPDREGRAPLARLKRVQYWDLAWTKNETSDYTASVTMSFDKDYNGYVVHAWHGRFDAPLVDAPMPQMADVNLPTTGTRLLDDVIVEQIETHRPDIVGIEIGAFKQAATKDLIRRVAKRLSLKKIAIPIVGIVQTRDKVLNARLPASRAENGMIYVDRDAMWYPTFENECLGFPKAKNDDIVDAFSGACQLGIERISTLPDKPSYYTFNKNESNSRSWVEDALAEGDVRVSRRT
jgi:predicted phage terminase large subunit-like protein